MHGEILLIRDDSEWQQLRDSLKLTTPDTGMAFPCLIVPLRRPGDQYSFIVVGVGAARELVAAADKVKPHDQATVDPFALTREEGNFRRMAVANTRTVANILVKKLNLIDYATYERIFIQQLRLIDEEVTARNPKQE